MKIEEVGCDFKGQCGNRLANGCCSNVPSLSCSWQKPKPSGRLLTDKEYNKATKDAEQEWMWNKRKVNRGRARAEIESRLKAQDAKTASIIEDRKMDEVLAQLRSRILLSQACLADEIHDMGGDKKVPYLAEKQKFWTRTVARIKKLEAQLKKDWQSVEATHLKGGEG